MTTIKITCSDVSESLLVRCDLSQAAAPIQVDYLVEDCGWDSTQYQCADARHSRDGLAEIGSQLLHDAIEWDGDFSTTYEIIDG
jgi:hypothetical protein